MYGILHEFGIVTVAFIAAMAIGCTFEWLERPRR